MAGHQVTVHVNDQMLEKIIDGSQVGCPPVLLKLGTYTSVIPL